MRRHRSSLSFSLFAFQDIITAVTGIILLITITLAILVITTSKAIPIEDRTRYHQDLQEEIAALKERHSSLEIELLELSKKNAGISRLSGEELNRELAYAVQSLEIANSRVAAIEAQVAVLGSAWGEQKTRDEKLATSASNENSKNNEEINHITQMLSDMRTSQRFYFNISEESPKRAWLMQISADSVNVAPMDGKTPTTSYDGASRFINDLGQYPKQSNLFVLFVRPSGIPTYEAIHAKLDTEAYDFGVDAIAEAASIVP